MNITKKNLLSNIRSPINNSLKNVKDEISELSKSYNNEQHLPFLTQLLEHSLKIFEDFQNACKPKSIEVVGEFSARGGISTIVRVDSK